LIQGPQSPPPTPNVTVVTDGARSAPSASAIYQGFRAQREELTGQLNDLQSTRDEVARQLDQADGGTASQKALEGRLADIDQRISTVDKMLAANAVQLAQSAAIPGAVVEQPPPMQSGTPDEAFVLGGIFMIIVFLPLSIAFARRIWRRSAAVVTSIPKEISERLFRMEQAVEATAVEVERIGEGQRFLTRLFTEGEGARALGAGAQAPIAQKSAKTSERLP
jgi:hypothetical protein